ncbi:hypothetical protein CFter6_1090 [Collimonas fungivorans]|uniref:Uncharacterized protein n=1 Tax=Collimonas fungivorans TaxID=158899 RepID=A0A127P7S5_9BURK|nr:hypothetical protein CFter6_1090 [Collimonas fungivorans]
MDGQSLDRVYDKNNGCQHTKNHTEQAVDLFQHLRLALIT